LEPGCFVEPTLIVDVPLEAPAWTDELFGPVVAIRPVTSLDAAITEINRSRYGLATSLFTSNLDAADAFIRQVDTGQVAINLPTAGWDVHLPFGGFRDSGSAWKEQGVEAIDFYTRVKTVAIAP
jgi:aldehyde dehydrogenase (NAD+)